MKRYSDLIVELFDKPVSHLIITDAPTRLTFKGVIASKILLFYATYRHSGIWDVLFSYADKFTANDVENEKQKYKIFSTVLNMMSDFIEMKNPEIIRFTSEKENKKDSRTKLYTTMVNKFAKKHNYRVEKKEENKEEAYTLFMLKRI